MLTSLTMCDIEKEKMLKQKNLNTIPLSPFHGAVFNVIIIIILSTKTLIKTFLGLNV